jgi:hypothetical protein
MKDEAKKHETREAVMKPIFFTMILLALPVSAYADWSNTGMHPALSPNFSPAIRVEPQHHFQPVQPAQPVHQYTPKAVNHTQVARQYQPVQHNQVAERRAPVTPGYFRRDSDYYEHSGVDFAYSEVDSNIEVPDGFEAIDVDGQSYYYNDGVFYQQMGDQLVAIPPVLGAVVDSIPTDYQIVMADGTHYLFTKGVFYQRVDEGFEVVEPPVSDQE